MPSSDSQAEKEIFWSKGHKLCMEKLPKDCGNNVYSHQPKVDGSLGDEGCWYFWPHTLCQSRTTCFSESSWVSPFMKWDFLEGVRGFCLAGCICLCNLSISWSLARGKRSQHVSDWKRAGFVKSPWLIIIAALRQIMSKECRYKCKERFILKC